MRKDKNTRNRNSWKNKKNVIKLDKNDSAEIYRFKDFNIVDLILKQMR